MLEKSQIIHFDFYVKPSALSFGVNMEFKFWTQMVSDETKIELSPFQFAR